MIAHILITAVALIALGVLAKTAYAGIYKRGYLNGRIDGYRKGYRASDGSGNWPDLPARRPGVIER